MIATLALCEHCAYTLSKYSTRWGCSSASQWLLEIFRAYTHQLQNTPNAVQYHCPIAPQWSHNMCPLQLNHAVLLLISPANDALHGPGWSNFINVQTYKLTDCAYSNTAWWGNLAHSGRFLIIANMPKGFRVLKMSPQKVSFKKTEEGGGDVCIKPKTKYDPLRH